MDITNNTDNFDLQVELVEMQKLFRDDYRALAPMMYYPPLCLKKNFSRFTDDLESAFSAIVSKRDYDKTLFGIVEKKWSKQLAEARELSKNGTIPAEQVLEKYLKSEKKIDARELPDWWR